MVSQIDRREDESADDREIKIEEDPFISIGQIEDHQGNLGVTTGHTVSLIML